MTPRYIKKREALLHAAAQVFNQHGVKGATLADVARRVGLSTNSVTYYYKKKEDLVVACMLQSIGRINEILAAATVFDSPEERVRQFIRLFFAHLAHIQREQAPEMMRLRDVQVLGDPHADVVFSAYRDLFRSVRRLLVVDGMVEQNRAVLNARTFLLMAQVVGAIMWAPDYDPDDHALVAAQLADILVDGLAHPSSEWCANGMDAELAHAPDDVETAQAPFLRAATALINEKDYRGASVDQISARLNVTKGSFYHYNLNKEDLIVACFERTLSVVSRMQTTAQGGAGSGWDRLTALARALVRYHLSDKGPLLRMTAWSEMPEEMREAQRRVIERLGKRYSLFLSEGMADGSIRPHNQALAAMMIRVMIDGATIIDHWLPDIHADNAADLYVRALFLGILRS